MFRAQGVSALRSQALSESAGRDSPEDVSPLALMPSSLFSDYLLPSVPLDQHESSSFAFLKSL